MGNESTKLAGESNEDKIDELIKQVNNFKDKSIPNIIKELEKLKKDSGKEGERA